MDKEILELRVRSWIPVIQSATHSSKTRNAWCAEHDISLQQFYYWQRAVRKYVLQHPECAPAEPDHGDVSLPAEASSSGPVFYEVSLTDEKSVVQAVSPESESNPAFTPEVMMEVGGIRLLIGKGVSEETLSTVMSVIRHV